MSAAAFSAPPGFPPAATSRWRKPCWPAPITTAISSNTIPNAPAASSRCGSCRRATRSWWSASSPPRAASSRKRTTSSGGWRRPRNTRRWNSSRFRRNAASPRPRRATSSPRKSSGPSCGSRSMWRTRCGDGADAAWADRRTGGRSVVTLLRSLMLGTLLSIAAVLALQPVYFASMANLDRVISQEAMRGHFRDAFKTGVPSDEAHPTNHLFTSGDRFTDCGALSVGMQPGISPLTAGILAPAPESDRHPCEDLRLIAEGQASAMKWGQYLRYWHGYRAYYEPLVSLLPIYAVKLVNLALLLTAFAAFFWQSKKLIGVAPSIGLAAPVLFLTDFAHVWHVTPHAVGVIFILGGTACFMSAVRRRVPDYLLLVLAAVFGSVFNFIDLLVNPPWMPMLLAFAVVCGMRDGTKRPAPTAIFVALAWFGGYGLTWFSKWLIAYFISTEVDVVANVSAMVLFRLHGDNAKAIH